MRKNIYIKNFLTTAGIVLMSFLILGIVFFVSSYNLVLSDKQKAMTNTANEVVSYVRYFSTVSYGFKLDDYGLKKSLTTFSNMSGFGILVADRNGTILNCSDAQTICEHLGKIVSADIMAKIRNRYNYGTDTDLGGIYNHVRYVMCVPLISGVGSTKLGYLFLSSDIDAMAQLWRQFVGVFLLTSAIVLVLTFLLTFFTTKKQTEPINEMALAARRFARGDFSIRVEASERVDEIGQLTEAFNTTWSPT